MCMYHAGFLLHRLIHVIDCTERLLSEEGSVYTNIGTHDHMLIWLLVCLQNILIPLWFRCRLVSFHQLFGTFIIFLLKYIFAAFCCLSPFIEYLALFSI